MLQHVSLKMSQIGFILFSQPSYVAPEVYLLTPDGIPSNDKVDIWSLGMILVELCLNTRLWSNLKLGQRIRKVISLIQCNSSVFEKIAREHNALETYQVCSS